LRPDPRDCPLQHLRDVQRGAASGLCDLLAARRYLRARYPLRYDVGYWGAVFPLGMYSAATHQMALALDLRFLAPLARGFFYLPAAWVLTASGLLGQLLRGVRTPRG
jgi:tellurite resistance protein TehA-like permease